MKLRNKKTGEIIDIKDVFTESDDFPNHYIIRNEWEDYEEPKEYWHIFGTNISKVQEGVDELYDERNKEIGNYFRTEEEAERAVEKLKAWKRLKDKGFKVDLWDYDGGNYQEKIRTGRILFRVADDYPEKNIDKDLDLLFGGEE